MKVSKEFIFNEKPTPSCHASTIVSLGSGRFMSCWFGGSAEGHSDVDIWAALYNNGIWETAVKISEKEGIPHWNPVLFANEDKIFLFYKEGEKICGWRTMVRISCDGGKSFSSEKELVPGDISGGRGPVKNKPILLSNGSIIAPSSHESADGEWKVFTDLSPDGGTTWERSDYIKAGDANLIQPSLWESSEGHVHMLIRSDKGYIYRADSADSGNSWSEAYPTDIPNNNSGLDLIRVPTGELYLLCNPVNKNWGKRTPLTVFVSRDNGVSFTELFVLEKEDGEYSYPSVIYSESALYAVYTSNREKIVFTALKL